jgi:hypothetical protein
MMWGTTPPCAKLIGDFGSRFEAALIGEFVSCYGYGGKLAAAPFGTFATWGNSGIEPDKGKGISSPGTYEASLMWPRNDGERQWHTMSDWTYRARGHSASHVGRLVEGDCCVARAIPRLLRERAGKDVPAGTMAMMSSPDFLRPSERPTAISTLNRQRQLTPSCGGFTPTAERTVGPARMIVGELDTQTRN